MPSASRRGYRERYRYHHGCERPKTALARYDRVIQSEAGERARIAADLEEAQRKAQRALAQLEARTREAEMSKARLEFMLDEKGHYVGERLPQMLKRYPMPAEEIAVVPVKRGRGRPRKDGSPAQPRSEAERTASRARRSSGNRAWDKRGRSAAFRQRVPAAISDLNDTGNMVTADASTQAAIALVPDSESPGPEPEARGREVLQPQSVEPVVQPPLAAALILPALTREVGDLLGDVDNPDEDERGQIEAGTISDKVLDIFSAEALAERAKLRDPRRLPAGYDPSWADTWVRDPLAPLPDMVREFITFGTAVDKRPEDLTDEEARLLAGPAMFPIPEDFDPADYRGRPLPPFFTREKDVSAYEWKAEITRAGGTMQKLVARNALYIDEVREIERARRRMWPYAVARRDLIKGLMEGLAVGELSFEPVSMAPADLARSVCWLVFRWADHDWLQLIANADLDLYYTRILDKLPWPEGLSRRVLLERFGKGVDLTSPLNMSSQDRPPLFLFEEGEWVYGTGFGIRAADGGRINLPRAGIEPGPDFGTIDCRVPIERDPDVDPQAWR